MTGLARRSELDCLLRSGCGIDGRQGWQHVGKIQRVEKT